ncbi:hypothetical protein LTR08_006115 [Meristemomyces frigidus]|nr:hypothetical protein LTR08_006115 [Meristemomyces frigidus]
MVDMGAKLRQQIETRPVKFRRPASDSAESSLEDSFTAVLDDILVAYGAAQIALANDVQYVPLVATDRAIAIDDDVYIYIALGMSIALLAYHILVIFRTRLWADLQLFNPFDFKFVVIAASAGGRGIAQQLEGRMGDVYGPKHYGQGWPGKGYGTALSRLYVEIRAPSETQSMPIIVAAEGFSSGWTRTQ